MFSSSFSTPCPQPIISNSPNPNPEMVVCSLMPKEMGDPIERGIQLAASLRQSKKKEILLKKRHKLYKSDPWQNDVTPSDFMHYCSNGADFSGLLPGLAKFLKDEDKV